MRALKFGDSDRVHPGELVLAFGSPLGLQDSVSLGVISAINQQLDPDSPMVYLQTDAAINPGNSGGPLIDMQGDVVGINSMIETQSGGNEGVGFSIPSNTARIVYEQLVKYGRPTAGNDRRVPHQPDPGARAGTGAVAQCRRIDRRCSAWFSLRIRPASKSMTSCFPPTARPMRDTKELALIMFRKRPGETVHLSILSGTANQAVRRSGHAITPGSNNSAQSSRYRSVFDPEVGRVGIADDSRARQPDWQPTGIGRLAGCSPHLWRRRRRGESEDRRHPLLCKHHQAQLGRRPQELF